MKLNSGNTAYPIMAYLIERRAFELYVASGRQEGHDLENWLQAERELTAAAAPTLPTAEPVATQLLNTVASLQSNTRARLLAESHGLSIADVAWEDTARTKGSCWGPNISDMTLAVVPDPSNRSVTQRMPMIRKPNFADVTADLDISLFTVKVGNEMGPFVQEMPFKEYLQSLGLYLPRDEQILTSAQACVLPLRDGSVEFNVQLYNYQSFPGSPGVLVILASAEGTSACVVNGTTPLYFNKMGAAANFLASRLSDDRVRRGVPVEGPMTTEEKARNALYVFQVPLKQKVTTASPWESCCDGEEEMGGAGGCFGDDDWDGDDNDVPERYEVPNTPTTRGFEKAVLGTTEGFADYPEFPTDLERDARFPVRCTVQYYNVTDTADISEAMFVEIASLLHRIYDGPGSSLVLTTTDRPTEPVV